MGAHEFRMHQGIKDACGSDERYQALRLAFEERLELITNENCFDTYLLSFAEHCVEKDCDGSLSMWRGYGVNGNGVALVIDLAQVPIIENSPFILSKVFYASGAQRVDWIKGKLDMFADLLVQNTVLPEASFQYVVSNLLERLVIFALFSKHDGFKEEREWRLVYLKERDVSEKFVDMLSYAIVEGQVQPKMKFKTKELERISGIPFSFRDALHSIILGPSISSSLTVTTVSRMFSSLSLFKVAGKVKASSTPYRGK